MKYQVIAIALALGAAALHPHFVKAADTSRGPRAGRVALAAPADRLAKARELIAAQQWSDALAELNRVDDAGCAEWNELVDFALRKGNTTDLFGFQ